ncbi:unnamed protein product [Gemmata massiliana]|uniref:Uncharacterized protein n=1 Tax=Gemmata massiliana TaxID=1210884 RepID=A0A6P2DBW5_9BACT|nr:hypothetical protein [Gemmata massiliana]VTR99273.1 unnamed protein product [Gemmata massiliana]
MLRICSVALLCFAPAVGAAADVPEIPAEKRKAFIDAVVSKRPKVNEVTLQKLEALEKATIDPKLTQNKIPENPSHPPAFRTQVDRDLYEHLLKTERDADLLRAKQYAENPFSYGPELKGFPKGQIGFITSGRFIVSEVVDERSVVLTMTEAVRERGTPFDPFDVFDVRMPVRVSILLSGINTREIPRGRSNTLNGPYYVAGHVDADGTTILQIIPFVPTKQEQERLSAVPKAEKK